MTAVEGWHNSYASWLTGVTDVLGRVHHRFHNTPARSHVDVRPRTPEPQPAAIYDWATEPDNTKTSRHPSTEGDQ